MVRAFGNVGMVEIAPSNALLLEYEGDIGAFKLRFRKCPDGLRSGDAGAVLGNPYGIVGIEGFEGSVVFLVVGVLIPLGEGCHFLVNVLSDKSGCEGGAQKGRKKEIESSLFCHGCCFKQVVREVN